MPKIVLDGEEVAFEGNPPDTLGELRTLLEQALGQNGRLLAAMNVDGSDFSEAWEGRRLAEFDAITGVSASKTEALRQLARAAQQELRRLGATADEHANRVLRKAWSDVQRDSIATAEDLAQVAAQLAALAAHDEKPERIEAAVNRLSEGVDKLADSIRAADAAKLALTVETELLPAIEMAEGCLSEMAGGSES